MATYPTTWPRYWYPVFLGPDGKRWAFKASSTSLSYYSEDQGATWTAGPTTTGSPSVWIAHPTDVNKVIAIYKVYGANPVVCRDFDMSTGAWATTTYGAMLPAGTNFNYSRVMGRSAVGDIVFLLDTLYPYPKAVWASLAPGGSSFTVLGDAIVATSPTYSGCDSYWLGSDQNIYYMVVSDDGWVATGYGMYRTSDGWGEIYCLKLSPTNVISSQFLFNEEYAGDRQYSQEGIIEIAGSNLVVYTQAYDHTNANANFAVAGAFPISGSFSGWSWDSRNYSPAGKAWWSNAALWAVGSKVYLFGFQQPGSPAPIKYFRWNVAGGSLSPEVEYADASSEFPGFNDSYSEPDDMNLLSPSRAYMLVDRDRKYWEWDLATGPGPMQRYRVLR